MKIAGIYQFDVAAATVWEVMTDPGHLQQCIPGCEELQHQGDGEYLAVLTAAVGPIRGKYRATIAMRDVVDRESYRLVVEGSGPTGFLHGEALIALQDREGGTTVRVDSDSQVGGPVARVGQRMMGSVAKMMMDRFFGCLQEGAREAAREKSQ